MIVLKIPVSDEFPEVLGYCGGDAPRAMQLDLVLSAYVQGRVSAGKSAELLSLKRVEFDMLLREKQLYAPFSPEELERDIAWAAKSD